MKNQTFIGAKEKASLLDLNIPSNCSGKLIVFVHGYMGFKDWGCWNLVEDYFTELGFGFCKYNVSHNGCSTKDSLNFVDLEAFAEDNYTKECEDFQAILSYIGEHHKPFPEIYVIGHSRGGGIALLQAKDERIKKVTTWAAISDIESRFPKGEALTEWKEKGYYSRLNGRTNQKMRHNYSQYIDFLVNRNNLDIRKATTENTKPLLLIHGEADTSVDIREGKELAEWSGKELHIIEGAAHTFGSSHPWEKDALPDELKSVCQLTAKFFLERN
ncbi:MAG: alpha/beta fold hydrolase [Crocinitomicaceae bacterium]|jgi:pimeloyl-ACP methyl ester carboxylesterase|nr:alpha/beta fold hydrolase [Crocinitomicaceae bacterium]MDG2464569.1 alpha/beta fold hydrolase [Crocinitomicaceae bacterium]